MHVIRSRQAERLLQENLPRRAAEQIAAAHDIGDLLCGIVDDDGKLVGDEAIAALQDEVADSACDVPALVAEAAIVETDVARANPLAQGARGIGPGRDTLRWMEQFVASLRTVRTILGECSQHRS